MMDGELNTHVGPSEPVVRCDRCECRVQEEETQVDHIGNPLCDECWDRLVDSQDQTFYDAWRDSVMAEGDVWGAQYE
jgi:hypothetical protein